MEKIFKNAESRKFLVTGASGFIGKAVVNYIMNVGGSVVAADFRIAPELVSRQAHT